MVQLVVRRTLTIHLFWMVNGRFHIPYKLRQIRVTQLLADGMGFAGVEPVMVEIAQEHGADAFGAGFATEDEVGFQHVGGEGVQVGIGGGGDLMPGSPHVSQGRGGGGLAEGDEFG